MIKALFPGGLIVTADSWDEMETTLRATEWRRYRKGEYRRELRRRALLKTGHGLAIAKPAAELFAEMESLGLCRLVLRTEEADIRAWSADRA